MPFARIADRLNMDSRRHLAWLLQGREAAGSGHPRTNVSWKYDNLINPYFDRP
jgi:hypothetical protein